MDWLMYLKTFLTGGALCAIAQILIDKTKLTPARILTSYVVAGVVLGALGLYKPLADWAGAGATVPLTGFGNVLAEGVKKAVANDGFLGVFTGGLTAAAAGICAAIFFGIIVALLCKPKAKKQKLLCFFALTFGVLLQNGGCQHNKPIVVHKFRSFIFVCCADKLHETLSVVGRDDALAWELEKFVFFDKLRTAASDNRVRHQQRRRFFFQRAWNLCFEESP